MKPITGALIGAAAGLVISTIVQPIKILGDPKLLDKYKKPDAKPGEQGSSPGFPFFNPDDCAKNLVPINVFLSGLCVTKEEAEQFQEDKKQQETKVMVTRLGLTGIGALIGYYAIPHAK